MSFVLNCSWWGLLVFLMAGIQQVTLEAFVPSTEIHIGPDQMLSSSLFMRVPLLLIFLAYMGPHYIVEIAI
jgi:hypothetical protein